MLYNFTTDFEAGKAFELKTIDLLNQKNPRLNISSDLDKLREYDIEITSKDGSQKFIEVKYDRWTDKTGNLCIEYAYKNKPSGISVTKSDLYFYYSDSQLFLLDVPLLKKYLQTYEVPVLPANEMRYSDNYLIKLETLRRNGIAKRVNDYTN